MSSPQRYGRTGRTAGYGVIFFLAGSLCFVSTEAWAAEAASDPALAWPAITSTMRPWGYWWWMGSAVDEANLSKELQRCRDAGMGGLHIIPIYGAKGYESKYIDYLSPRWMEVLKFTVAEAQHLGMGIDMTMGTGWCFGGPNITPELGGLRVQAKVVHVPAGGKLVEKIEAKQLVALVACASDGRSVDLASHVDASGAVAWQAGEGVWTIYIVSARPSRQAVKRAAPGGEGPMLNPFYGEAIRHYLLRFDDAFKSYAGPKPRAMYHDSYEYQNDWSPDLLAEFLKRRGYALQSQLPALFGTARDDRAARIKCDYRETISDMMVENFAAQWTGWSRSLGFTTRYQAHGSPGNLLDLYALADIPETEMFNADREILVSKFASSAAHVAGHQLTAAETGTWLAEHFTETLGQMKGLVDELFVSGVNHVIYHGTIYSPDEAAWPGWCFYASTEMNPRNSIWRDAGALNAYIARCQSILQSGRPDNDILVYWPIYDLWHDPAGMAMNLTVHARDWLGKQPIGATARTLWKSGYPFDYVSDRQLATAKSIGGRVQVPGGEYRVVLVPPCGHMPLATLEKLLALADGGSTVIFEGQLPRDVPGLYELEQRRAVLKKVLARVKLTDTADAKVKSAKLGAGRVMAGELIACLNLAGIARESLVDHPDALFIRRATDAGKVYFIANHGEQPMDGWMMLAAPAASAEIMDPMTGRIGLASAKPRANGTTQVYLQLRPGQSIIVRTFTSARPQGPAWAYYKPSGPPQPISGKWQVQFVEGGPQLPAGFQTEKLTSWTSFPDAETQRFAGTAKYSIAFDAPAGDGRTCELDLGKVCQSARVRLNGHDYGTLFTNPFRVVVDNLRPAGNVLEIEVTNVSANRVRDLDRRHVPWKIFRDINIVNMGYKPFDASDWPLHDSGLLGPVTWTPVVRTGDPP